MNLYGSITELQKSEVQLYFKLALRFKENALIRELWSAMANDVLQQENSLKALHTSFWSQLKKNHSELLEAVIPYARHQINDNTRDVPLRNCLELVLQFEEPTILKIYVPIIRSLRENQSSPALDFYIMVKAHLARIVQMVSSFSGDPVIIQRSSLLLQSFEREVQEPLLESIPPQKKIPTRRKETAKKSKKATGKTKTLAKRTKTLHHRTKHLVKKVEIQRRRARR
jgi:hypothetical protein